MGHLRFRTPESWRNVYPVHVDLSNAHWGAAPHTEGGVMHKAAPVAWPWWLLFKPSLVSLRVHAPSSGWRLWIYTRWGSLFGDLYIDRRNAPKGQV